MAGTSQANLMQTAVNAAATLAAAAASAGFVENTEGLQEAFNGFRDSAFESLSAQDTTPADGGSTTRRSKGGKSKSKSGGEGKSITVEDAKDTVLNYGSFEGETLGAVLDFDADQCAEYGYGDEDEPKTGKQYMKWLAGNDRNPFLQRRAKAILKSLRASSDEDEDE